MSRIFLSELYNIRENLRKSSPIWHKRPIPWHIFLFRYCATVSSTFSPAMHWRSYAIQSTWCDECCWEICRLVNVLLKILPFGRKIVPTLGRLLLTVGSWILYCIFHTYCQWPIYVSYNLDRRSYLKGQGHRAHIPKPLFNVLELHTISHNCCQLV